MTTAHAWSARYEIGSVPWDLGRPHPELERRLNEDPGLGGSPGTVLVPGAGTGHDASAFARHGWAVTAVDFARGVEASLRQKLEPLGGHVVIGDALAHQPEDRFDLIFDHTFFCAIDPSDRAAFGDMVDRLLEPSGRLTSIVFPIGRPESAGGPPWGIGVDDVSSALGRAFHIGERGDPAHVDGRRWPYVWAEWSRRNGLGATGG